MLKDTNKIILEEKALFSQSMLWDVQRDFYSTMGINAWSQNGVPYYVTSNSLMGKAYAEIAIAFLEDRSKTSRDTVYFLELGAGHGRFSFCFLKHFLELYQYHPGDLPPFCYIMSDFSEKNVQFWQNHPKLKPCIDSGFADTCLFDITSDKTIKLQKSGITLTPGSLNQPLVVIANYVFDTIPQELYYIEKQEIYNCLVSVSIPEEKYKPGIKVSPEQLFLKYDYEKIVEFPDMLENQLQLLEYYKNKVDKSHLLFPAAALECLDRLQEISPQGIMLLTSDKGSHHLYPATAPMPVPHKVSGESDSKAAFSFSVSYHIFETYCTMAEGIALFPTTGFDSIDTGCLLLTDKPLGYVRTVAAFEQYINRSGPDAVYHLTKRIIENGLNITDILHLLSINQYDPLFFAQVLPYILASKEVSDEQRGYFLDAVPKIWHLNYPTPGGYDLAYNLGALLFHLSYYNQAIFYFSQSPSAEEEYVVQDILFCYYKVRDYKSAMNLLSKLMDKNK